VGTFHDGRGELHGITVVVDTTGPEVWVGRCDTMDGGRIVLFQADRHDASDGPSKDEWVKRAAMVGFHPNHERVALDLDQVASVKRLGDVEIL